MRQDVSTRMTTGDKWWQFSADQVMVFLAATAAVCFSVFVVWKITLRLRCNSRRQPATVPNLGYVLLGDANVNLEFKSSESDNRRYRLLEAAEAI